MLNSIVVASLVCFLSAQPAPCNSGDGFCNAAVPGGSYCKYWQTEPVCEQSDLRCNCGKCPAGDSACETLNGAASYCKYWLTNPVCETGNQPCSCAATTPTPALCGDALCKSIDIKSY